jgi:hypothetical protein
MTLHIWAQMCSLFKTRRVMYGGRSRGFHAPMMFVVRSDTNRVCASQGRSHKRSEVVVVTPYGCTRVCSSSVNADLRASYQAKAPNATDTTAAIANNIHIAGFPPKRNTQLSPEWQRCEGLHKTALAALRSTVRAGATSISIAYSCRFTSHPIQQSIYLPQL